MCRHSPNFITLCSGQENSMLLEIGDNNNGKRWMLAGMHQQILQQHHCYLT